MVPPPGGQFLQQFSGEYEHRIITGGVGHNLPGKPRSLRQAVVEVDDY